ncbi:hypothetical protein CMK22_16385 [Candidatus Poribacteria bacterium]|nr:hypothetical protein [Candidatus Poribacteria bacterium]
MNDEKSQATDSEKGAGLVAEGLLDNFENNRELIKQCLISYIERNDDQLLETGANLEVLKGDHKEKYIAAKGTADLSQHRMYEAGVNLIVHAYSHESIDSEAVKNHIKKELEQRLLGKLELDLVKSGKYYNAIVSWDNPISVEEYSLIKATRV